MSTFRGNRLSLEEVARALAVSVPIVDGLLLDAHEAGIGVACEGGQKFISPAALGVLRDLLQKRRADRRKGAAARRA